MDRVHAEVSRAQRQAQSPKAGAHASPNVRSILHGSREAHLDDSPALGRLGGCASDEGVIRRVPTGASPRKEDAKKAPEVSEENDPSTIRRMGPVREVTDINFEAWSGIQGDNIVAQTDAGTSVNGWRGYSPLAIENQYFCHGHSLGTFAAHGYTVYSGQSDMGKVVRDEYTLVSPDDIRSGDLAVWVPNFGHSAKFQTIARSSTGALDPNGTTLSTKNGRTPLATQSLTGLVNYYRGLPDTASDNVRAYRRK